MTQCFDMSKDSKEIREDSMPKYEGQVSQAAETTNEKRLR